MQILVILLGTVIGAVIGWNFPSFKNNGKGKFERIDIEDDGIWLGFVYQKRFTDISQNAKEEIEEYLKKNFKGLTSVCVKKMNSKKIYIAMKIEKIKDDSTPAIIWLEDQEKTLTYYCSNY